MSTAQIPSPEYFDDNASLSIKFKKKYFHGLSRN